MQVYKNLPKEQNENLAQGPNSIYIHQSNEKNVLVMVIKNYIFFNKQSLSLSSCRLFRSANFRLGQY